MFLVAVTDIIVWMFFVFYPRWLDLYCFLHPCTAVEFPPLSLLLPNERKLKHFVDHEQLALADDLLLAVLVCVAFELVRAVVFDCTCLRTDLFDPPHRASRLQSQSKIAKIRQYSTSFSP